MTVVQELKDVLDDILKSKGVFIAWNAYLVKEKQQIIDAWSSGDAFNYKETGEKYYNKTYDKTNV